MCNDLKEDNQGDTMIALHDFNRLPEKESLALLHPCVAIPAGLKPRCAGGPTPAGKTCSVRHWR